VARSAQLCSPLAHELLKNVHRRATPCTETIAATLAAAIMMTSRFALLWCGGRDSDREGSNPIALLATIVLAPLAAMLIQAAISRSREYDADAGGAAIAGGPLGLVSALKKIESASKVPRRQPATAHVHHQAVLLSGHFPCSHAPAYRAAHQALERASVVVAVCETSPECGLPTASRQHRRRLVTTHFA
jgi:Zn-dependent protease with chaperone function